MTYLMPTGHTLQCLLKQNSNWLQWEVCSSKSSEERKRHKQRQDLKYYSRHHKGKHFVFPDTDEEPALLTDKDWKSRDFSAYPELCAAVAPFRECFCQEVTFHWKLQIQWQWNNSWACMCFPKWTWDGEMGGRRGGGIKKYPQKVEFYKNLFIFAMSSFKNFLPIL